MFEGHYQNSESVIIESVTTKDKIIKGIHAILYNMKCKQNTHGRKLTSARKEALRIRVVRTIIDGAKSEKLAKKISNSIVPT